MNFLTRKESLHLQHARLATYTRGQYSQSGLDFPDLHIH